MYISSSILDPADIYSALFFATLCSTAWWIWQNRTAGDNAATTTTTTNNPENGTQQVPIEMKQDTPYTGGPAPQYTSVAPQNNFPPVSPNGQYPQGYTQQQGFQQSYPQQQSQSFPQQQQSFTQQQSEQAPQGQGYYGGQSDATPSPQAQRQDIPNYPTPTPEMQPEHGGPAH